MLQHEDLSPYLLHLLPLSSLATLAPVSRLLNEFVLAEYDHRIRRLHPTSSSSSLDPIHSHLATPARLRYVMRVAASFTSHSFVTARLDGANASFSIDAKRGPSCLPVMFAANEGAWIIVAKGIRLEVWEVDRRSGRLRDLLRAFGGIDRASADALAGASKKTAGDTIRGDDDITGIAGGKTAGELILSRVSGRVQRIRIVAPDETRSKPATVLELARYEGAPGTIQSLSSCGNLLVAASSTRSRSLPPLPSSLSPSSATAITVPAQHTISLYSKSAPWTSPERIELETKPWSTLISPKTLAVGHSGASPLRIYPISSSGDLCTPRDYKLSNGGSTSVYAISSPATSTSSQYFRSDSIIFAGCYDSMVRVYDARASDHLEVMQLCDPYSDDACYSISKPAGPLNAYLAVGTARNAALRLFDLRSPSAMLSLASFRSSQVVGDESRSITVFGQKHERSPVYGIVLEYSRIYAVSEKGAWLVDFDVGDRRVALGGSNVREGESGGYYRHSDGDFRKSALTG